MYHGNKLLIFFYYVLLLLFIILLLLKPINEYNLLVFNQILKQNTLHSILSKQITSLKQINLTSMNATFAEVVKSSGNRAVRSNPPHDLDFHLTEQGSDWLWALFSIFGCLAVVYIAFFFIAEAKGTSLTKYALATTLLISMFNAFGYFTYASNLGWAGIQAEFNHLHVHPSITGLSPGVRQIFYAKYCAWFLSWPLLIFLNEMTGMSISEEGKLDELSVVDTVHSLLFQILGTEFWVVSLLVGSLIKSTYKWGYWVFGCVAMLLVEYIFIKRQFIDLRIRGFTMCMHITYSVSYTHLDVYKRQRMYIAIYKWVY